MANRQAFLDGVNHDGRVTALAFASNDEPGRVFFGAGVGLLDSTRFTASVEDVRAFAVSLLVVADEAVVAGATWVARGE